MLIPYKLDGTLLKLHPCLRPGRRSRLCLAEEVAEDGLQDVPVPCEGLGPLGRLGLPRFGLLVVFPVLFGPRFLFVCLLCSLFCSGPSTLRAHNKNKHEVGQSSSLQALNQPCWQYLGHPYELIHRCDKWPHLIHATLSFR